MSIQLILGPMFSGKSTELIRRVRRRKAAGDRCIVLKPTKDTRGEKDSVATHSGDSIDALVFDTLLEFDPSGVDIIGVNEGQFFEDIVEVCEAWANAGKTVIVAALDGTFDRKPFGRILELVPMAEDVQKLTAVCKRCKGDAAFSRRRDRQDKEVVRIGGADLYEAVCRRCYWLP